MHKSGSILLFLIQLVLTSNFWLLFLASLTCALMMAWRSAIRDDIFKYAQKTVGRKVW